MLLAYVHVLMNYGSPYHDHSSLLPFIPSYTLPAMAIHIFTKDLS